MWEAEPTALANSGIADKEARDNPRPELSEKLYDLGIRTDIQSNDDLFQLIFEHRSAIQE